MMVVIICHINVSNDLQNCELQVTALWSRKVDDAKRFVASYTPSGLTVMHDKCKCG